MKILFIENRDATILWDAVAAQLARAGHEVGWLVQNHAFVPSHFRKSKQLCVLPYPLKKRDPDGGAYVEYANLSTERGRTYFKGGTAHYRVYADQIDAYLSQFAPDLVIGESTLFHELLAIELCKARGIMYVQPMGNRYPCGRFSFHAYDTQTILGGSGDSWPDATATEFAVKVSTGEERAFYLTRASSSLGRLTQLVRWLSTRGRVFFGRLAGERYNTPSLWRKVELQRRAARNLKRWCQLQRVPNHGKTLLYALQQQPEANIDVWGQPYSNQVSVVRQMLHAAPADVHVAIKINPMPRYAVSEDLLQLAQEQDRVCLLPVQIGMAEAQRYTTGALTITGTIGFEAIFGKGRCLSLRHPIIEDEFPEFHADSIRVAVDRLLEDANSGRGSARTGARLIQYLVRKSYPGVVSDPVSHPTCMEQNNVSLLASALHSFHRSWFLPSAVLSSAEIGRPEKSHGRTASL